MTPPSSARRTPKWVVPPRPPGAITRPAALSLSLIDYLGLFFLYFFLFLAYSRVGEIAFPELHLPFVTACGALLAVVLAGQLKRALASRWGLLLFLLTACFVAGVPSSLWPGGSAERIRTNWLKSLALFVVIAALVRTIRHCQQTMLVVGMSAIVITLMCLYFLGRLPMEKGHRMMLPGGTLENPNDLAQILLMGLPCWGLVASQRGNLARKLVSLTAMALIFYVILQTGSRSAIITLAVAGLVMFVTSSAMNRLRLAIAAIVFALMFGVFVPDEVRQRYLTILTSNPTPDSNLEEATASASVRKSVLIQSIKVSLRSPIFGVGVGNFQVAAARSSKEDNLRALWLETHNSYTQISSEAGLPALAVFVMLIWYSLRQPFRMYKAASRFPQLYATAQVGFWLSMTVLNYAVTILFTSVAYSIFLPTLAGLASAYADVAQREIAQAEAEASPKPAGPLPKQRTRAAGTPRPVEGYRGQISR